jgi:hypothetical protein
MVAGVGEVRNAVAATFAGCGIAAHAATATNEDTAILVTAGSRSLRWPEPRWVSPVRNLRSNDHAATTPDSYASNG